MTKNIYKDLLTLCGTLFQETEIKMEPYYWARLKHDLKDIFNMRSTEAIMSRLRHVQKDLQVIDRQFNSCYNNKILNVPENFFVIKDFIDDMLLSEYDEMNPEIFNEMVMKYKDNA